MFKPSLPYNLLKFSLQMFHRVPHDLESQEYDTVQQKAEAECILQTKVLASEEGLKVVVPEKTVQEAIAAISNRYESPEAFERDLAGNDLDLNALTSALEANLAVEATMAQVAAQVEPPNETLVDELFQSPPAQGKPEQRRMRHILITINDQFPENRRQAALSRITKIREKVLAPGIDFSELAQHYSECPSALQGGSLSPVARGSLYPSLEETLFTLAAGEISEVVESNMGFHVLLCEEVIQAEKIRPEAVRDTIRKTIHAKIRKKAVQTWLTTI